MPVIHLPIPTAYAPQTAGVWLPFVERIVKRSRNSIPEMVHMIGQGDLLLHLAWETETKTPHALALTRVILRGGNRVAEFCFHWGKARTKWEHLLPVMEQYHKETLGCTAINIQSPLYWKRALEKCGYRLTHHIMEKDL